MNELKIKYIARKLNKKKVLLASEIEKEIFKGICFFSFLFLFFAFIISFLILYMYFFPEIDIYVCFMFSLSVAFVLLLYSGLLNFDSYLTKRNKKNIERYLELQILLLNFLVCKKKKEAYVQYMISIYDFKKSSLNFLFFENKEDSFSIKDYEDLCLFRNYLDINGVSFLKDRFFIRSDIEEYHKIQKDKKKLIMKEKEILAKIKANKLEDLYDFETNKENQFESKIKKPESKIINL